MHSWKCRLYLPRVLGYFVDYFHKGVLAYEELCTSLVLLDLVEGHCPQPVLLGPLYKTHLHRTLSGGVFPPLVGLSFLLCWLHSVLVPTGPASLPPFVPAARVGDDLGDLSTSSSLFASCLPSSRTSPSKGGPSGTYTSPYAYCLVFTCSPPPFTPFWAWSSFWPCWNGKTANQRPLAWAFQKTHVLFLFSLMWAVEIFYIFIMIHNGRQIGSGFHLVWSGRRRSSKRPWEQR